MKNVKYHKLRITKSIYNDSLWMAVLNLTVQIIV